MKISETMVERLRTKTILSIEQRIVLAEFFKINMFPTATDRESLAIKLCLKPRTIQIWFQNQRQKHKSYYHNLDYEYPPRHALNLLADVILDVEGIEL